MNSQRFTHLLSLAIASGVGLFANAPSDPGWPRSFTDGTAELTVFQPQVDSWAGFKVLNGRCAFELRPARDAEPIAGTFRYTGDTLVDADRKIVLLRNIRAADMRFPAAPAGNPRWTELTRTLLPTDAVVLSLDRVIAFLRTSEVPQREARIVTDPPPILVSNKPAILVMIDGDPVMVDVPGTALRRVVNSNWDLYQERPTGRFYLRNQGVWLAAADLRSPFAPAGIVTSDLKSLPVPTQAPAPPPVSRRYSSSPHVFVTHKPAELIVILGSPELEPIPGTNISTVTNTDSDLFFDTGTRSYYFLTTGRWFRSTTLEGDWQYASASLPSGFTRIPPTHPKAHVLASVPGTREAEDAILLASIPRTATVSRANAKAEVLYAGAPQFASIPGTTISYAKNTQSDVLRIGDLYYLCFQAVWFVSTGPNGPWQVTDRVPTEVYSIPESSPKYNVTYVRVYESTPTTVVVGYTTGYHGAYVAGGVVVWGTGYYYPPYVAVTTAVPVYWGASYYTYGAGAWYNPATGVYARGAAVYGPYGGYGAAAAYNPRTGTYAQGVAASGPYGSAAAGRTYNPVTGNRSAGYSASNAYGSWGEGVVSNGSDWARGGYQSGSRGTIAAGETSKGGAGVAVQGANGNSGYAAKTASGDLYAGANGNVYKRDDGQWYKNQNGSWNAVDKNSAEAPSSHAAARDRGNANAQAAGRSQPSRDFRSAQGSQRTRPQGRRR